MTVLGLVPLPAGSHVPRLSRREKVQKATVWRSALLPVRQARSLGWMVDGALPTKALSRFQGGRRWWWRGATWLSKALRGYCQAGTVPAVPTTNLRFLRLLPPPSTSPASLPTPARSEAS